MKNLSNTKDELKKNVAFKRKRVLNGWSRCLISQWMHENGCMKKNLKSLYLKTFCRLLS